MRQRWAMWEVSDAAYLKARTRRDRLKALVHYAILAPSSHNSQPWLFRLLDDGIELYADRSRALPIVDPDDRELTMSCGAALFHLGLAIRHFGREALIAMLPGEGQPDLLARVTIGKKRDVSALEHLLFRAIPRRRTNRQPFDDKAVSNALQKNLVRASTDEGAWLHIVRGDQNRNAVADLVAQADRLLAADRHFRRELAAWLHPNRRRSRDGMPGYAYGIGDLASYLGPLVVRTFDWGRGQAARDRQLAMGSPLLAVLGTDDDGPRDWLVAGQALAHVLLRACVDGVSASYLNQPIEVSDLRPLLCDHLGRDGYPQILLRMGVGAEIKPTPRRPVEDVLFEEDAVAVG